MKLKEARKEAIKFCRENRCDFCFISYDNADEFRFTGVTDDEHTVFMVGKNGSFQNYARTKYARNFHEKFKKRADYKGNNDKREIADMVNYDLLNLDLDDEDEYSDEEEEFYE